MSGVKGRLSTRPQWDCNTEFAGFNLLYFVPKPSTFPSIKVRLMKPGLLPLKRILQKNLPPRKDFQQGRERLLRIKCVASIYDAYYKVNSIYDAYYKVNT